MLPRRFRSSVADAPCGPGRLATGTLVTLAVSSLRRDLNRVRRVKAATRSLASLDATDHGPRDSSHEGDGGGVGAGSGQLRGRSSCH
jgi:hypothetical protein